MENNITELVFIIDESGSMHPLVADTLGGFNSMLEKQRAREGAAYVTTVLFNTELRRIHDRLPLREVPQLSRADYSPGGCTALLDAIGDSIGHIETIHRYARQEDVPESTMFVIITDGMENSSHRFTAPRIKELIGKKKEEGWEFVFLGANIDAVSEARNIGISSEKAVNFHPDKKGMTKVFEAVSCAVSHARCAKPLSADWKADAEADFESR